MRNLIINRRKSFVGCAVKMKVYIEDPRYGDTKINGVPCTRLGVLKNGEEASFVIPEEAAKLYVIGDRLTRNISNDFCVIPAGEEDVYLSGAVDHSALSGNPFRFDGEGDEHVQANRKRVRKNGVILLIAALIVGIVFGIGQRVLEDYFKNSPRDFSSEGMTITLTRSFKENTEYDFAGVYESNQAVVIAQREGFDRLENFSDLSLREYADLALYLIPQTDKTPLQEYNGIPWFEYNHTNPESDESYNYLTCIYKADDAFWTIQFIAPKEKTDQLRPDFMEYAASVRFE